jgi:CheY-like chemotaxis protein
MRGVIVANKERQPHILVINDMPQILDLFVELLGDAGYRVTPDRFTLETDLLLAQVKELAPDLILLDLIIGAEGMGWQFLQMLKMDRETRDLPVVLCTAAVRQAEELQSHLDEMGVAVVLKPFDIDHLVGVVAKALEAHTT